MLVAYHTQQAELVDRCTCVASAPEHFRLVNVNNNVIVILRFVSTTCLSRARLYVYYLHTG